jgi:hypothetical protein
MSFNFGTGRNGLSANFSLNAYHYDDLIYRKWVTRIALDFYTGRQDSYVWLDLQKQFRNPEKMQIVPYNLTQEIVDETSILYREEPVYVVKDSEGKTLDKETKLWKKIRKDARYHNLCQQLDSMTKLLGTVLVKISFVDPETGDLVNQNKPGMVQFDLVYGGNYNVKWTSSPYYLNEIDFGFGESLSESKTTMGGTIPISSSLSVATRPTDTTKSYHDKLVDSIDKLGKISKIKWSIRDHEVEDVDGKRYTGENPYGCIPAIPFFNQDPGNRYYLPINEPLIYANHSINMRLSDLNHVTKYQSFGQAVVKGIERPVNNRMGRPVDDYNARSGTRSFGVGQGFDTGPTGLDRNFFSPFDYYQDGNATANMNGFSLGPDTLVSVGETGDFKYVSPNADISGLVKTIYTMMDMIRINHGLRPKHDVSNTGSGYNATLEKLGVVEKNKKRAQLFREREEQLFQVVKKLWNVHHAESGEEVFSDDCELNVHYVEPEFAVDPQTRMVALEMEQKIIASGDTHAIKKIKPHLDDAAIKELIVKFHEDKKEQLKRQIELNNISAEEDKLLLLTNTKGTEESDTETTNKSTKANPKTSPAKHSEQSSIQPKNGDPRVSEKTKRREEQSSVERKT